MGISVFEAIKTAGIAPGTIVISDAGHDKGRAYLVVDVKEKIAFLADGRARSIADPKKKRVTHVKVLGITEKTTETIKELSVIRNTEAGDMIVRDVIKEFILKNRNNDY